ncbi:hypothetical protein CFC21_086837 [Triticum aestivum]|uniref:DUF4220 domain-containing protein n=2 Tax=Triticum aestivum TaxID=4565 RepID=A0A3B6PH44_WHEAT|nr:hypothetical protein CFC21_086837 [Triticum aestivum]
MAGFSPPVPQQDSNWEIRVAVMLSLLLQVLILFLGHVRKRSSSPPARFAIWSSYLLADWVADLALGLILNNMGNIGGNPSQSHSQRISGVKRGPATASADSSGSSPIIFAFWTPFLLVHLGGQDSLTALSIQDNDFWLRNLTGFFFQLISAGVVFFCSVDGNHVIPATLLIFVVGIIKYGERIYSLYSGSVDGVLAEIIGDPYPGPNYEKFMSLYSSKERAGLPVELVVHRPSRVSRPPAPAPVEHARGSMAPKMDPSVEVKAYKFFCIFRQLCFDVKPSYKERMLTKAYFLSSDMTNSPATAFKVIELELNFMYDMVHTKEPIAHSKAGCILRFVASSCLVSSLLIFFFHSDKGGISRVDVAITYALLLGGMALDAAALAMLLVSTWTLVLLGNSRWLGWLARAGRFLRPQQRRRRLAMVAEKLHVREMFHDFFFVRREPVDGPITREVVFDVLKKTARMETPSTYRGEGVLHKLHMEITGILTAATPAWSKKEAEKKFDLLVGSVKREFVESLLIWHIATDLCRHPYQATARTKAVENMRTVSQTLSEYMLYLLIKQPKILLASAGIGLKQYQDTCAEAKRFFETAAAWEPDHAGARRMLLGLSTAWAPSEVKGSRSKSVLFDGVILAKQLRDLGDDLMWEVVASVWGEMLTYAAGKCKGSTHVQQLSRGGELITIVWFLMAHMGFSDEYKKDEQDEEHVPRLIVHN